MDLYAMLEGCDNFTITVSAKDLREYSRSLIADTIEGIRKYDSQQRAKEVQKSKDDELVSRKEALKVLHISSKTIIDWEKKNVITPFSRVGKVMYRRGDLRKLTEVKL